MADAERSLSGTGTSNNSTGIARVVIAGRPNVGKSTLFNSLSQTRRALVGQGPGITRDLRSIQCSIGDVAMELVDSGGIVDEAGLSEQVSDLAYQALRQADIILLLVDARDGILAGDEDIIGFIRKLNRSVLVVLNKVDGVSTFDLASLVVPGWQQVRISARTGRGVKHLQNVLGDMLVDVGSVSTEVLDRPDSNLFAVSLLGRPNVGKSTLMNQLLHRPRSLVADSAGTTVDEVEDTFTYEDKVYRLLDTAGVRRRPRITGTAERIGVARSLVWLRHCDVGILLVDATQGIVEQDARLLGLLVETSHPTIVVANKWDLLDERGGKDFMSRSERKMRFATNIRLLRISALCATGIVELLKAIHELRTLCEAQGEISTAYINKLLQVAITEHPPAMDGGIRPKLRFAHANSAGDVVIHGSRTKGLDGHYKRYLRNFFQNHLKLPSVKIKLVDNHNPYIR